MGDGTGASGGERARPQVAGSQAAPEPKPLAPRFSARVDDRYAVVRVRGHLDRLGAEDIAATLRRLREQGHHGITVEARSLATTDDHAAEVLTDLAGRLAEDGVLLAIA